MMYWNNWHDFFAMGGYALYVWGSVLVVAGSLCAEVILVRLRRRTVLSQIARTGAVRVRRST